MHLSRLVASLVNEMEQRKDYAGGEPVKTIYLGGGTPSMLDAVHLDRIFNGIFRFFSVDGRPEITMEMNPEGVTDQYLRTLKAFPVNRISVGVQSFSDKDLGYLGRVHDAEQARQSVLLLKNCGFENISVDLIFGIPTLTVETWQKNLDTLVDYDVQHISAYALTVEEKTLLEHNIKGKKTTLPHESSFGAQYNILKNFAKEHGFLHYEISNFAKNGFISEHNSAYWKGIKYSGIGPSAHSYDVQSRQWNVKNIARYMESVKSGHVLFEKEMLSMPQMYNEYVMTRLRTMWGCDLKDMNKLFGREYVALFSRAAGKYIQEGLIQTNGDQYTLTDSGEMIADMITAALFADPS